MQGELILQDAFQVWDPKSLIRKGRERHLFLFEISLVFSKEIKDSSGHTKYVYKNKLLVGGTGGVKGETPCLHRTRGQEGILTFTAPLSPCLHTRTTLDRCHCLLFGKLPSSPPISALDRLHSTSFCLLLAPPSSPSLPSTC